MNNRTRRPRPAHLSAEQHLRTGRRLAALRKDAGLSQVALANALGRRQPAIANLETGRTRLLFSEAVEIAEVLNVDVRLLDPRAGLLRAPRDPAPERHGRPGRQLRLPLAWGCAGSAVPSTGA